jgi:carbon storage regulator CsrA
MLVLTRERDQSIMLGSGAAAIEIKVVSIRGGCVQLGIIAPHDLVVDRKEVWEEKQREGRGMRAEGRTKAPMTKPE